MHHNGKLRHAPTQFEVLEFGAIEQVLFVEVRCLLHDFSHTVNIANMLLWLHSWCGLSHVFHLNVALKKTLSLITHVWMSADYVEGV